MSSPSDRKYQATMVHRRVVVIQKSVTRPAISAATANANGTVKPVNPRYSATGWVIMPESSSSGLSPRPSAGGGTTREDTGAGTVITSRKKAATLSITVSTQGYSSRA